MTKAKQAPARVQRILLEEGREFVITLPERFSSAELEGLLRYLAGLAPDAPADVATAPLEQLLGIRAKIVRKERRPLSEELGLRGPVVEAAAARADPNCSKCNGFGATNVLDPSAPTGKRLVRCECSGPDALDRLLEGYADDPAEGGEERQRAQEDAAAQGDDE